MSTFRTRILNQLMQKRIRLPQLSLAALLVVSMIVSSCGSKPKQAKELELEEGIAQLENYNYDTLKGI